MKLLMTLMLALQLAGCAEMAHDRGQDAARNRCEMLDIPADRSECRRQAYKSFEDYTKDRQKLSSGQSEKPSK